MCFAQSHDRPHWMNLRVYQVFVRLCSSPQMQGSSEQNHFIFCHRAVLFITGSSQSWGQLQRRQAAANEWRIR